MWKRGLVVKLATLTTLTTLVAGDWCNNLCRRNANCRRSSSGSYEKPSGDCHGFFMMPSNTTQVCYHDSHTSRWCLSSFPMVRAADVQRIIATLTVPSSGLSDSDSDDDEPRGNFNVSTTSFSRGWSGFGEEYSPTTIFPGRWGGYRGEDFGRVSFPPASSVEELRPHLVHLIDFPALWPRTLWYREGAGMQIVGVLAEALVFGPFY